MSKPTVAIVGLGVIGSSLGLALKKAGGSIPHPLGEIAVAYERKRGEWEIEVDLPGNLKGSFVWEGRSYPLKAGRNRMVIRG